MKSKPETTSRTVLPIPDRPFTGTVVFDAKDLNSKFPPIEPLRPPKGAPNVLLILLDDAGFAAMNTFGGPCTYADCGPPGRRRPHLQPVPRLRSLRADSAGVPHRPQQSLGRYGHHHRGRDRPRRDTARSGQKRRRRWRRS